MTLAPYPKKASSCSASNAVFGMPNVVSMKALLTIKILDGQAV
jgi:hypothetical protein